MALSFRARIKAGAIVFQDFAFMRWPISAADPSTVFRCEVAEDEGALGSVTCRAFGYGVVGKPDGYGNGALLLSNIDDLMIEDETTRKEILSAKRQALKARYNKHVEEMRELSGKMTKIDAELRALEHTLP